MLCRHVWNFQKTIQVEAENREEPKTHIPWETATDKLPTTQSHSYQSTWSLWRRSKQLQEFPVEMFLDISAGTLNVWSASCGSSSGLASPAERGHGSQCLCQKIAHILNENGHSGVEVMVGEQHVVDETQASDGVLTIIATHHLQHNTCFIAHYVDIH